jgi:phospholipid-binding lipoprotein MlaA
MMFAFASLRLGALPRLVAGLTIVMGGFLLQGCATPPSDPAARAEFEKDNDPLEPFNRAMFQFNLQVDGMFFKPAATVYREVLPEPVQKGVNNFLSNLRSPLVLANDLLQGEMGRAGNTTGRFVINTTVGILGVWDPATSMGMERHSEDFGQTFAKWGVGDGMYLVLPFFGPSNPRDTAGLVTEYFLDPVNIWARNENADGWITARAMTTGIDFRARNMETLDELERTSIDYYTAIRSLYRQRRANEILNGAPTSAQPVPGISYQSRNTKTDNKSASAE